MDRYNLNKDYSDYAFRPCGECWEYCDGRCSECSLAEVETSTTCTEDTGSASYTTNTSKRCTR